MWTVSLVIPPFLKEQGQTYPAVSFYLPPIKERPQVLDVSKLVGNWDPALGMQNSRYALCHSLTG